MDFDAFCSRARDLLRDDAAAEGLEGFDDLGEGGGGKDGAWVGGDCGGERGADAEEVRSSGGEEGVVICVGCGGGREGLAVIGDGEGGVGFGERRLRFQFGWFAGGRGVRFTDFTERGGEGI